jgi:glycosyltransferase involved in cell wall biosynthesis
VRFLVVGGEYRGALPRVENRPWSLARERADLHDMDLGLMPLPDDEWSRGKCGFKALLYMSVGIPAVCSPVGVNRSIIDHGVNGILAGDQESWYEQLAALVDQPELRRRLGEAGRQTVVTQYSVAVQAPRFVGVLEAVVRSQPRGQRRAN